MDRSTTKKKQEKGSKVKSGRAVSNPSRVRKLDEDLERKAFIFEALFRLFEKLGGAFEQDRIIKLFLTAFAGHLGLKKVAIYLAVPTEGIFRFRHSVGTGSLSPSPFLGVGSSFSIWLRKENRAVFIDRFFAGGGDIPVSETRFLAGIVEQGLSYACPMENSGEFLGIIFFGGKLTGRDSSDFDNEFLEMLVRVAAITIRNASIYQDAAVFRERAGQYAKLRKEFIVRNSEELKMPLSVLKSTLWSIESDEAGSGILIDMAKDAVTSMGSRLDQFLSLCDIDMGETSLNMEKTDISSLAEETLREYIPEFEEKSITVRFNDKVCNRELYVDAPGLKVVIRNILDNAIRHIDRGGVIEIDLIMSDTLPGEDDGVELRMWNSPCQPFEGEGSDPGAARDCSVLDALTGEVSFKRSIDENFLVIKIRNNGISIPDDKITTLSLPFRKGSFPDGDCSGRAGIGLAMAQNIIYGHGGKLLCKSSEGKGSEFSVWLPAAF